MVKLAQQAVACDSLVRYQEFEINKGLREQQSAEELLRIRTDELRASQAEVSSTQGLYQTQVGLTKEAKKQKRKWVIIAIGGIVLAAANFFH
jgi:hypothetical protein